MDFKAECVFHTHTHRESGGARAHRMKCFAKTKSVNGISSYIRNQALSSRCDVIIRPMFMCNFQRLTNEKKILFLMCFTPGLDARFYILANFFLLLSLVCRPIFVSDPSFSFPFHWFIHSVCERNAENVVDVVAIV